MKHILLLNSHTRPFVPSVEDDIGSRPSALLELGAGGSHTLTHSGVRECSVNLWHVSAGTHPAAHLLLLSADSESQR